MISLFKNNIYVKISTIFLIYFSLLFYLKYEINITFLIISFILFTCIILAIYNNNDKFNLLFKKSDDLYFNATNTKKKHSSLDEIITTINFIENDIIKKHSNISILEKSRSKFLGNVSHELKTPLFVVQGYVDTLLDGAIDDNKVNLDFLKKIKNQTDRLDFLLTDLIKISMIESDELKLDLKEVELDDIISEMKNIFNDIINKRGDNFIVPDKTNIKVNIDKEQMVCVFNNLINNAINYSTKGDIILSVKKDNDFAHIKLIDHGIGISESHLPRIFERFYRVDSDRSRNSGGTGLGLAIVKHILLAHGIQINIKSQENVGSEFSFSIPLLKS